MPGERYLGIAVDRERHAADLKAALGGIKGPLMKVAQLLATIPEALPEEYVRELIQLQSNAPAMGWPFVRRRMMGELGPDWQSRFKSFEREAARAASLGQVHRATALDGTKLACKLQYPDMASAVEADLRQLRLAMGLYERYDRAVSTAEIHAEIAARLREELDYEREAAHMRLYAEILKDEPAVAVPTPHAELSTKRLITMTWLDGGSILDIADSPLEARNEIALRMFRIWYVPFYFYGVIHGDPHLGNYLVASDRTVNLLDFGCIRVFPAAFVKGVIDLYHALEREDDELAVQAYQSWGFGNLSNEMIAVLNRWARFVYGPLLDDRTRPIQEKPKGPKAEPEGPRLVDNVHRDIIDGWAASRRRARLCLHGPGGDRARIGVPSPQGRDQLAPAVFMSRLIDDFDEGDPGAPPTPPRSIGPASRVGSDWQKTNKFPLHENNCGRVCVVFD